MAKYNILCGAAPKGFQQKRLVEKYNFRTNKQEPDRTIVFPNGVSELFLEGVLNNVLDDATEKDEACEVLLYFCALKENDLCAELSGSCIPGIEIVKLGTEEIRKDVIEYYENLAEKMDVILQVEFEADSEYVCEKELGYEPVR